MLNFVLDGNSYKIVSDYSVYKNTPLIHNQTLVRKTDGIPHYTEENVESVRVLSPVITEHYGLNLYNEKNKQRDVIRSNKETVPVFLTNHTTSFHHFLIDVIGKIIFLQSNGFKKLQIVIVVDHKQMPNQEPFLTKQVKSFHKEIFSILGLPDYESCIVNLADFDQLTFDKVVVVESTTGNMDNFHSCLQLIRNKFVKKYSYENKIYVSRKKAVTADDGGRRVEDDDVLAEYYTNNGYSVVYFEDMTSNELYKVLHDRGFNKVLSWNDEAEKWSVEEVYGPIDKFAETFFEGEKYQTSEIAFLKHNLNILYLKSQYGKDNIMGSLLNCKVEKILVYTMLTNEIRGNLTIDELQKIIKLSLILTPPFKPENKWFEDEKDEHGRTIIKNRFRVLDSVFKDNISNT
jgi:hypothetical protein